MEGVRYRLRGIPPLKTILRDAAPGKKTKKKRLR